jgi:hypothetical protein
MCETMCEKKLLQARVKNKFFSGNSQTTRAMQTFHTQKLFERRLLFKTKSKDSIHSPM